jgi:DNA repair exonuclease SbcCD ATPase subunit
LVDNNEQSEVPIGEELAQSRIAELERLAAEKDEAASQAQARITGLEQLVAELQGAVTGLEQSNLELEQKLAEVSNTLSQAIASYKARVIESHPEVPAELIAGDTIEAVDNSLGSAQSLISKVREGIEAEMKMTRIPAGAPLRAAIDFSALSPREKIQHGIGGFSS